MPVSRRLKPFFGALRMALFASLIALSACSDCSCSDDADDATTPDDEAVTEEVSVESFDSVEDRVLAILRLENLALVDKQTELFLAKKLDAPPDVRFSFESVLGDFVSDASLKALRREGNPTIIWLRQKGAASQEDALDWVVALPVQDLDAFLTEKGATAAHHDLIKWQESGATLWSRPTPLALERGQSTDRGDRVVISNTAAGALHAPALLTKHVDEQRRHLQTQVWPKRLGLTDRWSRFATILTQRLSASGHGLVPGRASLVNLETNLYRALGDPANWPEKVAFRANYKIRGGGPRQIRTFLHVPPDAVANHATLAKIHEAMRPRKGGIPPSPATEPVASLRMRLDRLELEDLLDTLLPPDWRMLLASRGEDSMVALAGTAKDLLEHNRGPTLAAFYPQEWPLSGEVFLAFEAMDLSRMDAPAQSFNETLIKNFSGPLHLANPEEVDTKAFSARRGALKGQEITFRATMGERTATLGACWAIKGTYYYSYFGQDPCARLQEVVRKEELDKQPPSVTLESDLAALLDLLYIPPNARLRADFAEEGTPARVTVTGHARDDGELEIVWVIEEPRTARTILRNVPRLKTYWHDAEQVDLSELLGRTSLEQSIYQEPSLMLVGPPGLLGAAPPAYFMGLPFSLPPAPPAQLKRAVVGPDASDDDAAKAASAP